MPDEEHRDDQEPEEDEFEARFRELEARAKAAREGAKFPDPPKVEIKRPNIPGERAKQSSSAFASRSMGIALAIGYAFVGPVLAGILVGWLLDRGNGVTWTAVGTLVGFVVAFVLLIRLVNKLNEYDK